MPVKIVNCKEISREEWLEYRRAGIGGSDAAVPVCPWCGSDDLEETDDPEDAEEDN